MMLPLALSLAAALAVPRPARADVDAEPYLAMMFGAPAALATLVLALGLGVPVADGDQPHPAWTTFGFLGSASLLGGGALFTTIGLESSRGLSLGLGISGLALGSGLAVLTIYGLSLDRPDTTIVPVVGGGPEGATTFGVAMTFD